MPSEPSPAPVPPSAHPGAHAPPPVTSPGGGAASSAASASIPSPLHRQALDAAQAYGRAVVELHRLRGVVFVAEEAEYRAAIERNDSITAAREAARYSNVSARVDLHEAEGQAEMARAWWLTVLACIGSPPAQ